MDAVKSDKTIPGMCEHIAQKCVEWRFKTRTANSKLLVVRPKKKKKEKRRKQKKNKKKLKFSNTLT